MIAKITAQVAEFYKNKFTSKDGQEIEYFRIVLKDMGSNTRFPELKITPEAWKMLEIDTNKQKFLTSDYCDLLCEISFNKNEQGKIVPGITVENILLTSYIKPVDNKKKEG